MKIDYKGYESHLEDEHIEMYVDLESKVFFEGKKLSEYWSNMNTATK